MGFFGEDSGEVKGEGDKVFAEIMLFLATPLLLYGRGFCGEKGNGIFGEVHGELEHTAGEEYKVFARKRANTILSPLPCPSLREGFIAALFCPTAAK